MWCFHFTLYNIQTCTFLYYVYQIQSTLVTLQGVLSRKNCSWRIPINVSFPFHSSYSSVIQPLPKAQFLCTEVLRIKCLLLRFCEGLEELFHSLKHNFERENMSRIYEMKCKTIMRICDIQLVRTAWNPLHAVLSNWCTL